MKKLVLMLSLILLCMSGYAQTIYTTLNGIKRDDILPLIASFPTDAVNDKHPQKTAIWFSKTEVINIAALLNSELTKQKPDGVRIYFIKNPAGSAYPYKIALVSTSYKGPHPGTGNDGKIYDWHKDYYDHDGTAYLFQVHQLSDLEGTISNDDSRGAALLYTPTPDDWVDDSNCDFKKKHFRKRRAAETMVKNFVSHATNTHAINTQAVWFELDFINYLASTLQNKSTHSGVRVYFATHSPDDSNDAFADRDTFVITTTDGTTNSTYDADYFYCDDPMPPAQKHKNSGKQQQISPMQQKNKKLQRNVSKGTRHGKAFRHPLSPPQDKGELCPDNCN